MAPAQKKQKTETTEKELEDLLFGDVSEDIWDKAGHELEDQEEEQDAFNDESNEEDEEEAEQTFFFDSGPIPEADPHAGSDDEIDYEAEEEMEEQGSSDQDSQDSDQDGSEDDSDDSDHEGYKVKGAWEDEDDKRLKVSLVASNITKKLRNDVDEDVISGVEYSRRLRKQFVKIYPEPDWARLPSDIKQEERKRKSRDSDDESDDENQDDPDQLDDEERLDLLKSTMGILEKRGQHRNLPQTHLDIMRLKDANVAAKAKKHITSIAFHPNAQVLMTAGLDRTLRLFQIDGKINPKIQSVYFKDMPIYHAEFHPSGNEIILSGRRKYFYIYDIQSGVIDKCPGIWGKDEKSLEKFSISPCGKFIAFCGTSGKIMLVSYLTKKWVADLKVNKVVESITWSSDGKYLFAFNNDGEVYQFNAKTRECVKRWMDDGCIGASIFRVSPNEKYYAAGSGTGIVNVYDRSVLQPDNTRPTPIKAIGNLTTRISEITFNHDSQLMVIASRSKKDQLKVVHLPSGTVYSNWPTERTPLGHVISVAFSPNSDYLAIANDKGHVRLHTLKHYALK